MYLKNSGGWVIKPTGWGANQNRYVEDAVPHARMDVMCNGSLACGAVIAPHEYELIHLFRSREKLDLSATITKRTRVHRTKTGYKGSRTPG